MLTVEDLLREVTSVPVTRRPRRVRATGEEGQNLAREIANLPEQARLAVALRIYESLSVSQIATILDLPPGEVQELLVEATRELVTRLRAPGTPAPTRRGKAR